MSAVISAARRLRRRAEPPVLSPAPAVMPDPAQPDDADARRVWSEAGWLWLPRDDTFMRPYVQRRGVWDESGGNLLRSLVRGDVRVLDVGAGVGYFSIVAWRVAPQAKIVAVEPNPRALPLLHWNLWVNGVPQPTVHPVLLGEAPGTAWVLPDEHDILGLQRVDRDVPGAHSVEVVRGDDLFAGVDVDLIRVALRGWEREAVGGLLATAARAPRAVLVVRFSPHLLRARGAEPHDVLRAYREWGFDRTVMVSQKPAVMSDDDVVLTCDNAGPHGRVHLVLR